jgi:HlyD family secretion protein
MKKRAFYFFVPVVVIAIAYFLTGQRPVEGDKDIVVDVQKGTFRIEIATTGELEARNSVLIQGPMGLRNVGIWNIRIERIVPEGTVVKKGDFIASLDRSDLTERINNQMISHDQATADYTQATLDTAIQLRRLRDDLINKQHAVEERKLILEQSQYEPPATIKQNELNLSRAVREYEQGKENYKLESDKAIEQVRKASSRFLRSQNQLDALERLVSQMTIYAPDDGMVIYNRDRRGSRMGEGSTISSWDPTVATLPDLTTMNSKTFINEVDIRQIKAGQPVIIGLDAFPEKRFTGKVVSVANIGGQTSNSDAKVFEVMIEINEADPSLRPAMTTSNTIIAAEIPEVVFVPLEALHSQGDTLTYVFKRSGLSVIKQQVIIGPTNTNEAVIEKGLSERDRVLLSMPLKPDEKKLVYLDERDETISSIN